MGGAASKPRSPESERRGGGETAGGRASAPSSRSSRALALGRRRPTLFRTPMAESRDPGSLSRPCEPLIAREAASGAPEWYALGPGRRRTRGRRRTAFQGPLPRPRPPTCPRPRPPPSCAQWVHSFLLVRSTNIYRVPTGCPAPGRAPQGCGGRNPSRPSPSRDSQSGPGRRPEPDSWDLGRGGRSWGNARGREHPRRLPKGGAPSPSYRSAPSLSLQPLIPRATPTCRQVVFALAIPSA